MMSNDVRLYCACRARARPPTLGSRAAPFVAPEEASTLIQV